MGRDWSERRETRGGAGESRTDGARDGGEKRERDEFPRVIIRVASRARVVVARSNQTRVGDGEQRGGRLTRERAVRGRERACEREHEHREGGTQEASPRRVAGPVRARLLKREEHAADGGAERGGEARGDPRGEEIARVLVVTKGVEAFAGVRGEDDAVADDEALLPREETRHARADVHEGSLGSDGKARGHGEDRPEHLDEDGGQGEEPRDVDAVEARHDERDSGAGCGGRDAEHEEGGGDGEEHGGGDGDGGRGEKAARRIVRVGVEDTLDDCEPRAGGHRHGVFHQKSQCANRRADEERDGPFRHASGVSTGAAEGTVVDDLEVQGLEVTDFLAPIVARAELSVRLVVAAASGRGKVGARTRDREC